VNKSVLVINYDFPPAGGPGVQRVLKFVKYLPCFGWHPIVVTARPEDYPVLDVTLNADVPSDTPIFRTRGFDINQLRPAFERVRLGKVLSAVNAGLLLPDSNLVWANMARSVVKQAIETHQPCAMITSSPPHSTQLLGMWAHRTFGLPWIADLRDPWSENRLFPYFIGYRGYNRWLEWQVISQATLVTTVSQPLAESFARFADQPNKIRVIENGYDEEDIELLPAPQTARFTIAYTGEFSRVRRPDLFIEAIDRLVRDGQIPLTELRVVFAGKNTPRFVPSRPPYEQLGYLMHNELNLVRRETDLLLLMLPDTAEGRGLYTGKLFEYLACNRPTLVIAGPDNVAAELVARAKAGIATEYDSDKIMVAVLEYYRAWKAGRFDYAPNWDIIHHFTRRNLAGILTQALDRIAGG
jgi:glycosyltransferase involved in cell wall biosynthesis